MRIIILFFMFSFVCIGYSSSISAQERSLLDYSKIKKEISKKNSPLFYQELYNRYKKGDTSLNKSEYQLLYYGSVFTKLYEVDARVSREIKDFTKRNSFGADDIQLLKECVLEAQKHDLFHPELLWLSFFCETEIGNDEKARLRQIQFASVCSAILSYGDGLTIDNPIHLILKDHASVIMNFLGFEILAYEISENGIMYCRAKENSEDVEGVYFDISIFQQRDAFRKEGRKQKPKVKLLR